MVLGINEYLNNDRKDSDNKFYMFKKFYQRIMKETDSSYQDVLEYIETLKPDPRDREGLYHYLYIFGHSLDITDKDINDIKLLLYDIKESQNEQNKHISNINNFINLIIVIYVIRIVLVIGIIILILKYGIDIFNGIM